MNESIRSRYSHLEKKSATKINSKMVEGVGVKYEIISILEGFGVLTCTGEMLSLPCH